VSYADGTLRLALPNEGVDHELHLTFIPFETFCVTGSSRESTTDTQARSTDISIHLSPARRGEPDSLGADSVAPTIHRNNNTFPTSPKQQYLPDAYHKQVQGPRGTRQPYSRPRQPYSTYLGTNANPNSPPLPNPVALNRIRLFAISLFQFRHLSPFYCSWVFSAFATLFSVLVSV
jgi:hypothetical protein